MILCNCSCSLGMLQFLSWGCWPSITLQSSLGLGAIFQNYIQFMGFPVHYELHLSNVPIAPSRMNGWGSDLPGFEWQETCGNNGHIRVESLIQKWHWSNADTICSIILMLIQFSCSNLSKFLSMMMYMFQELPHHHCLQVTTHSIFVNGIISIGVACFYHSGALYS